MSNSKSNNQLINLFYSKYLKKINDIKGLVFDSSINGDNIIINISNPNDLSYSPDAVVGYFEEVVHDFSKFINGAETGGNRLYKNISDSLIISIDGEYAKNMNIVYDKKFYLNKQDLRNVEHICDMIRVYKIDEFWSKCKVTFEKAYVESGDDIALIELNVVLLTPEWEGQPLRNMGILSDKISEMSENENFIDYEYEFASSVTSFFWNNPLMVDKDYMGTQPVLNFYTPEGKFINYW
jgi:hypothetical protein